MDRNNSFFLYISAVCPKQIVLSLKDKGQIISRTFRVKNKNRQLSVLLAKFLEENDWNNLRISKIIVDCGLGSFTGIRISMACGLTLGLLLGVKVNKEAPVDRPEISYQPSKFD